MWNIQRAFALLVFIGGSFILNAQDGLPLQRGERLYQSALELMAKKQFGAARKLFDEYSSTASDHRKLSSDYYSAICALHLYHRDGEKKLEQFIARNPDHALSSIAYFEMANFYYQEKNYGRAVVNYSKANFSVLSSEQQNTGRFRWGYSHFNLKNLKESNDQFNNIKAQGGTYGPAASYYAGFAEYQQGDYENALIDFKRAEGNPAYATVVPSLIGNVLYRQRKYDEVISYAASIKSRNGIKNADELALLVAEAHYRKKDFKTATISYEQYLTGKELQSDKGVLLRAGHSAYLSGSSEKAAAYLKQAALATDSTGYFASYYLGSLYLKSNQKPLALTAFDYARKYKKDKRMAEESAFAFAKLSYELGNADGAIHEFENLLIEYPKGIHTSEVKELLSQAYVNANNYNKAIEYIESLATKNQAIIRAYQKATLLKGMDYFNKEDHYQAQLLFEKSIQSYVDKGYLAEAAFWAGESYAILKKQDLAIPKYQQVLAIPDLENRLVRAKAYYGLGYAWYDQKQYDQALPNFREYVQSTPDTDPNKSDGYLRLADCFYIAKKYPDALVTYRKALQLRTPDADYAHLQLGIVNALEKNYAEGRRELDFVVKNYPQSTLVDEAIFERGQLDFTLGNYASATESYSQLVTQHRTSRYVPYAYVRRAAANFNLKEYGKTADDYIILINQYPGHPAGKDIVLPLQEALNLAGRQDEFDSHLTKIKQTHPDAKGVESVEFEVAKNLYLNQEYSKALQHLTTYVVNYPDSPRRQEVIYYQAECHYRLKNFDKALTAYHQIYNDPTFSFSTRVTARVAELEFKSNRIEKALEAYSSLAKTASNKKDQYVAWSGLMESYYLLASYDSADMYARLILEKGSVHAGAQNKSLLYLGKTAMARGDYETAKDEFVAALNSAQDEYGAEAKYLLGEIFYLTKDYKACYETLVELNKDFTTYQAWRAKSYLLLSDNYLAMGDAFQARGTLQSLIDNFPDESVKKVAREKLRLVEQSVTNKTIASDTIDNPKE
jgi:tetratricopeptide (TPR) repeat protein